MGDGRGFVRGRGFVGGPGFGDFFFFPAIFGNFKGNFGVFFSPKIRIFFPGFWGGPRGGIPGEFWADLGNFGDFRVEFSPSVFCGFSPEILGGFLVIPSGIFWGFFGVSVFYFFSPARACPQAPLDPGP